MDSVKTPMDRIRKARAVDGAVSAAATKGTWFYDSEKACVVDADGEPLAQLLQHDGADENGLLMAAAPTLLKALDAILRATNTIEVLGEWTASDVNHRSQKMERAKVEAIKADARFAMTKAVGM